MNYMEDLFSLYDKTNLPNENMQSAVSLVFLLAGYTPDAEQMQEDNTKVVFALLMVALLYADLDRAALIQAADRVLEEMPDSKTPWSSRDVELAYVIFFLASLLRSGGDIKGEDATRLSQVIRRYADSKLPKAE